MPDQPPSPSTPTTAVPIDDTDDRVLATTTQLAGQLEDALDCRIDDDVLEELLLELDRGAYVEWVTISRDGEYVWDLTESPDRIADAVAEALVERALSWLEDET